MPFRPASAPTSHSGILAQRRKGSERTGNRVQFAGPEIVGSQCERRRMPKDPLPDSDEEQEIPGLPVTPSPLPKNAEVKWWHVPDTQIEELVQHIEEQASSPYENKHSTTLNQSGQSTMLNQSGHSALNASSTPCSSKFAASSSCRALAVSGRPKLRSLPNKIACLDTTRQTDFSATGCSSETERLDFSGTSASSTASPQKKRFSSVTSAKTMLLESRPPPFNAHPKRPFTAPELSTRNGSANAPSLEQQQQRPWSSSSTVRPKTSGSSKETSASDKDLIQVDLVFYTGNDRIQILIHPDAPMGPRPGGKALFDKASLKGMIAKLTGISTSDQRLLCRGSDVSHDHKSLRQLNIGHGCTVKVYDKKDWHREQSDVVLACTAKLVQKQEAAQQQAKRHASFMKGRKGRGPKIMPKWGWGTPPNAGTAVKGWHATGQDMSLRFEDHTSWRDNEETPSLSHIRAGLTFTQPIELVS